MIIVLLLAGFCNAEAQGGSAIAVNAGLQIQSTTVLDVGVQAKHYWVFDTASNNGPGAGCELIFGANSGPLTFGPKLFYQVDISLNKTPTKAGWFYAIGRFSVIRYTNTEGNDWRLSPEAGISFYDEITLTYGYNFSIPGLHQLSEVYTNRFTLFITIKSKKRK